MNIPPYRIDEVEVRELRVNYVRMTTKIIVERIFRRSKNELCQRYFCWGCLEKG